MSQDTIQVTRSSMSPLEEYIQEITPLWETHWLTNMGQKHKELEIALKKYLGVDNLALFTNGHTALECILEALQLGQDGCDEVITTPFTFASTTHALVRKGLKPVFCDIKEDDYTIDPNKIETLITPRTCAIVPVHVYGNLCDVNAIQAIVDTHGLKVVYDAAHAFGVRRGECSAASYGDASMFSFHATKVFNTIEGGAVSFKEPELYNKLNQWKNFGITGPEDVVYVGGNAKMNEFCAAMGLCNLRHVDDEIEKRKLVAQRYWNNLSGVRGVKLVAPSTELQQNYAYMPVVFQDDFGVSRDDVFEALREQGINARKYFYPLTSDFECYTGRFPKSEKATPIAFDIANRILTLPMYADLSFDDVDRICKIIKNKRERN